MNMQDMQRQLAETDRKIAQLQSIHRLADRADANHGDFDAIQSRADSALMLHGRRAGQPMLGESVINFRRRMASEVKKHSPEWKDLPLSGINDAAFERLESSIYADAAAAPPTVNEGELRCVPKTGFGGHAINEYHGSPRAWMDDMAGPVRQYVRKFMTNESA